MTIGTVLAVGIAGLLTAVAAGTLAVRLVALIGAVWVRAEVTGAEAYPDPDGRGTLYRSTLRFESDGAVELKDSWSFPRPAHRVGQRVWLHHRPGRPEAAEVWRAWPLAALAGVVVAGGGVAAAVLGG